MDKLKNKITLSQAFLIYIVATYSPFIRYITKMSIIHAHQAGWLSCLVSMVFFIPLLFVLYKVSKAYEGESFHDILCYVFGKTICKILSAVYIIWLIALLSLYVRYAGSKLTFSIYIDTDINIIMFLFIAIVAIMLRWGIRVLERMNKIIFAFTFAQFIFILAFLYSHFSLSNVTPISTLDIMPLFKSSFYVLTISSYITFIFIFNDQIDHGQKKFSKFLSIAIFLTIVSALINLGVLGIFGWQLAEILTFPFLSAVNSITVFDASAGLSSLFISMWMLADFVIVSFLTYCAVRLIKNTFHLKSETPALTAVLGFAFFLATYLSNDIFELIIFSQTIAVACNLALGFAIPILLYCTGKARRLF